jgi:hypothetical protein
MTPAGAAWVGCALALIGCAADPGADASPLTAGKLPDDAEVKVVLADAAFDPGTLGAEPKRRAITFYDTPSLESFRQGVLFRSRDGEAVDDDDVTVKLRPMFPAQVHPAFHGDDGFKCELDVNVGKPGASSCSLTLPRDLFGPRATAFARQVLRDVPIGDLRPLGPIASTVWKVDDADLGTKVTFERWVVPGGDTTLEASIKVSTPEVAQKEKALLEWLGARRLSPSPTQVTKTAAALAALSRH